MGRYWLCFIAMCRNTRVAFHFGKGAELPGLVSHKCNLKENCACNRFYSYLNTHLKWQDCTRTVFVRIWKITNEKSEWLWPPSIYWGFRGEVALHLLRGPGVFWLFLLWKAYFAPKLRLELGVHSWGLEPPSLFSLETHWMFFGSSPNGHSDYPPVLPTENNGSLG